MSHKKHAESHEAVEIQSQSFFDPGISYNPEKNEVKFSDEAKIALQNLVHKIQSKFPVEPTNSTTDEHPTEKVTLAVVNNVADAMLVAWKWEKATNKFWNRAISLLGQKKVNWGKIEEKVQEKVQKYRYNTFAHITIHYIEWDETKSLHDTPIIVRPWEDLETMLKSLKTRLRFPCNKK